MQDRQVSAPAHQQNLFKIDGASHESHSPKRPRVETAGMADVFPYYAGFSFGWACTKLRSLIKNDGCVILDPWNGSGTTTLAAQACGHFAIGVDLNPIANVVAQLRVSVREGASLSIPPRTRSRACLPIDDPLCAWLAPETALRFRQWQSMLQEKPTSIAALGLVALFRVVRKMTASFEGSNPTWVRRASDKGELISLDAKKVDELLLREQSDLLSRLRRDYYRESPALITTASSSALPIADESVDAIITSPPYLTRIDYAVAYSRELAILGFDIKKDRTLRESLMGTTLIRAANSDASLQYGQLAEQLIDRVSKHPSKASGGYYLKQFRQYLDDLSGSLDEITRVSKNGAPMTMVVQDSYYKDVPIELAAICIEEACSRGWTLEDSQPIEVTRLLTQMNTSARAYPKGKVSETVITLRRDKRSG